MAEAVPNSTSSCEGVNKDFFTNFGHPEDADSFAAGSKLLMVRHA